VKIEKKIRFFLLNSNILKSTGTEFLIFFLKEEFQLSSFVVVFEVLNFIVEKIMSTSVIVSGNSVLTKPKTKNIRSDEIKDQERKQMNEHELVHAPKRYKKSHNNLVECKTKIESENINNVVEVKQQQNPECRKRSTSKWNQITSVRILQQTQTPETLRTWVTHYLHSKQLKKCCSLHWQQHLNLWYTQLFTICLESEHQPEQEVHYFLVFLYSWRFLPSQDVKRMWIDRFFTYFGNRLEEWFLIFFTICHQRNAIELADAIEIARFMYEELNTLKLDARKRTKLQPEDLTDLVDHRHPQFKSMLIARIEHYTPYLFYILQHRKFEMCLSWLCFLWKNDNNVMRFLDFEQPQSDILKHVPDCLLLQTFFGYFKHMVTRKDPSSPPSLFLCTTWPRKERTLRFTSKPARIMIFDHPFLLSLSKRIDLMEDFHMEMQEIDCYDEDGEFVPYALDHYHRDFPVRATSNYHASVIVGYQYPLRTTARQPRIQASASEIKSEEAKEEKETIPLVKENEKNTDDNVVDTISVPAIIVVNNNEVDSVPQLIQENLDDLLSWSEEEEDDEFDEDEGEDDFSEEEFDEDEDLHHSCNHLHLRIDRERLFDCFINRIQHEERRECTRELKVRFTNEEMAADAGGVQREAFRLFFKELFDPKNMFWTYDEETGYALPMRLSESLFKNCSNDFENKWMMLWETIGTIIGIALSNNMWSLVFHSPLPIQILMRLLRDEEVEWKDFEMTFPTRAKFLKKLSNPAENKDMVYENMPPVWSGEGLFCEAGIKKPPSRSVDPIEKEKKLKEERVQILHEFLDGMNKLENIPNNNDIAVAEESKVDAVEKILSGFLINIEKVTKQNNSNMQQKIVLTEDETFFREYFFHLERWRKIVKVQPSEHNLLNQPYLDCKDSHEMKVFVESYWKCFLGITYPMNPWDLMITGITKVFTAAESKLMHPYEMKQYFNQTHQKALIMDIEFLKQRTEVFLGNGLASYADEELQRQNSVLTPKHCAYVEDFWSIISSFTQSQRQDLLLFITADADIVRKMEYQQCKIVVVLTAEVSESKNNEKDDDPVIKTKILRLPVGHTCVRRLDLPQYPSAASLKQHLLYILNHTEGFGII
jgi:hypothetical protein